MSAALQRERYDWFAESACGNAPDGVALINRGSSGADVTLRASDIGLLDTPKLARNLWAHEDQAEFAVELARSVQPHETLLFRVTPS